jgi:hypothetical protein
VTAEARLKRIATSYCTEALLAKGQWSPIGEEGGLTRATVRVFLLDTISSHSPHGPVRELHRDNRTSNHLWIVNSVLLKTDCVHVCPEPLPRRLALCPNKQRTCSFVVKPSSQKCSNRRLAFCGIACHLRIDTEAAFDACLVVSSLIVAGASTLLLYARILVHVSTAAYVVILRRVYPAFVLIEVFQQSTIVCSIGRAAPTVGFLLWRRALWYRAPVEASKSGILLKTRGREEVI